MLERMLNPKGGVVSGEIDRAKCTETARLSKVG